MTLVKLLFGLIVITVGLIFILFPQSRVLLKAFMGLFFDNVAATPEGAAAIYAEKIEQATEIYNNAKVANEKAKGKYKVTFDEIEQLQKAAEECERKCNKLAQEKNKEALIVMAQERENIIKDIAYHHDLLDKYEAATKETSLIFRQAEKNLDQLKQEKKETVQRMKDNKNVKELYDQIDKVRGTSATDRLLDSVRDKDKELNEIAEGAKIVHKEKLSTKKEIAEDYACSLDAMNYANSLIAKYGSDSKRPAIEETAQSAVFKQIKQPVLKEVD